MRYGEEDQESKNVEDLRGQQGGMLGGGGDRGGFSLPMGGGGLSITTLLIKIGRAHV